MIEFLKSLDGYYIPAALILFVPIGWFWAKIEEYLESRANEIKSQPVELKEGLDYWIDLEKSSVENFRLLEEKKLDTDSLFK
jgi:hypothetical protein